MRDRSEATSKQVVRERERERDRVRERERECVCVCAWCLNEGEACMREGEGGGEKAQ